MTRGKKILLLNTGLGFPDVVSGFSSVFCRSKLSRCNPILKSPDGGLVTHQNQFNIK